MGQSGNAWNLPASAGCGLAPTGTALSTTLAQGSTMLSQAGSAPGTASVYKMRLRADPYRSQITQDVGL